MGAEVTLRVRDVLLMGVDVEAVSALGVQVFWVQLATGVRPVARVQPLSRVQLMAWARLMA